MNLADYRTQRIIRQVDLRFNYGANWAKRGPVGRLCRPYGERRRRSPQLLEIYRV
jgi:hypothetical protein